VPPPAPTQQQLPGPLRLRPSFPFVGRPRELAVLRSLLPLADGEGRRIALIGGEAGSGKTRLVREFAHEAAADGALVLHGGCDAVVRTPYRPIVEALDHLVRVSDLSELMEDLGPGRGELRRLLPDLSAYAGPLPEPIAADQDTERHRLHAAVTDFLVAASLRRPLLVVVEDGHWADRPSLLLLRHLSNRAADARMLLVATFRDTEADVPDELSETLADLRRSEGVVRLRLTGLGNDEVAEFMSRAAAGDFGDQLPGIAAAITALTGGNPFLVTELWRQMTETGVLEIRRGRARLTRTPAELGTPEGVREVATQRLARLDPDTAGVLELAAVAGLEFELAVLSAAAAVDHRSLLESLDRSARSGMIVEVPGRTLRFRFTHELVRRALYDRLGTLRRAELHLCVGEALEAASSAAPADLAHHFAEAARIDGAERAVAYSLRASRAAAQSLAFEEAAAPLRTALELGAQTEVERAEIHLELGWACFCAGKSVDAMSAYWSAAQIAGRLADGELLARAAVGYEDTCYRQGIFDAGALELLSDALAMIDPGDSQLRVMLLAGVARAQAFVGDHLRSGVVLESSIAMARRLGDRRTLASVLARSYWAKSADPVEEVIDMLSEGRDLAVMLADVELEAEALEWRIAAQMAIGDLETCGRDLEVVSELADRTRQPFILHVAEHYRSALALAEGRLDEADAAAERSREWGRLLTGRDASGVYGIQTFSIRREQGRLAELGPVIRVLAAADRTGGAWRPGLVALLAELGMADEARRELEALRSRGLDELRRSLWIASLTYITDACSLVGDSETAAAVYPLLAVHAGSTVMIGHGVACYGSADRYLGMLARLNGERDRAGAHFETAMAVEERMGADTWLAHSSYEYGRLLVTGDDDERERASAFLDRAAGLAERIGMPTLLGRVRALRPGTAAARVFPDGLSKREVEILRQVARGKSNREIGRGLFISEHTVANHVRNILRKTGSANRTEAAAYAHTRGVIDP
jgi:DNA-binding CsgD family transcriptional regulator/tetratricopeptide (TPR) repeat protein